MRLLSGVRLLSARRLGARMLGMSLRIRRLGVRRLGLRRLGISRVRLSRLGVGRFGGRGPGPGRLGPGGLELSRLGRGFRSGLSLPLARAFFLACLLQRDLLLDGLLLAHRFLISPFLAGRLAIGGPRRGGPVQA